MRSFATLASVALVALRLQALDASSGGEPTIAGNATSTNCLSAFNEARAAAGLTPFKDGTEEYKLTAEDLAKDDQAKAFIPNVCKALLKQQAFKADANFNKTIALAVQDGDQGDCSAAVTHFNGALSLFGNLPPVFSNGENVYKSLQAVSFVALYNPNDDPKLACGYFNCTSTPADAEGADGKNVIKVNGLLCATGPQALISGKAPFEQAQFDKIKSAISSASASMPAFITLAVAAAGLTLL